MSQARLSAEPRAEVSVAGAAGADAAAAPRNLPLLARRQNPWLVVAVDDSVTSHDRLVWALREAARREATVVAVAVLDMAVLDMTVLDTTDDPGCAPLDADGGTPWRALRRAQERLDAQVQRAIVATGVHGRIRTSVLDRVVYEALAAGALGADLVVVGAGRKALLRHALPPPRARRRLGGG